MSKLPIPNRKAALFSPKKLRQDREREKDSHTDVVSAVGKPAINDHSHSSLAGPITKRHLIGLWVDDGMLDRIDQERKGRTRPDFIRNILDTAFGANGSD